MNPAEDDIQSTVVGPTTLKAIELTAYRWHTKYIIPFSHKILGITS